MSSQNVNEGICQNISDFKRDSLSDLKEQIYTHVMRFSKEQLGDVLVELMLDLYGMHDEDCDDDDCDMEATFLHEDKEWEVELLDEMSGDILSALNLSIH